MRPPPRTLDGQNAQNVKPPVSWRRRPKLSLAVNHSANPKGDHVFQWKGALIDDCNTRAFQEAARRAGVAPLRWHDLRHTGASWASMRTWRPISWPQPPNW